MGSQAWALVPRQIMESGEAPIPPLVVVSATHGWGKTTWMHQYSDYVREHTDLLPHWVKSRAELSQALEQDEPQALFVDMLMPTLRDPLWEKICDYAETHPDSLVVASSIDRIPPDMVSKARGWEVWETTLGFTPEELQELVDLNVPDCATLELALLQRRLRGHPHLVRRHLERLRSGDIGALGTNPDAPTERLVLRAFQAFGARMQTKSCYLALLLEGAAFRRFDLSMLKSGLDIPATVRAGQFERLRMSPLGKFGVDQLTGRETFEWSASSWDSLQLDFPERSGKAERMEAFQRTVESGSTTLALFYLLDLGLMQEAEKYLEKNLRLFLLYTPAVVKERLYALPLRDLDRYPNLALLTGEMLARSGRSSVLTRRSFQGSLVGMPSRPTGSAEERFRALAREAFVRVSLGEREEANRRLDSLLELLGSEQDPGPIRVAASSDLAIASVLGDELFLPFWTSTQLDRHSDALDLGLLARNWVSPDSPTRLVTVLTSQTQEIFAGFLPEPPEGVPPGTGHTDALLLLEEGRGAEALELARGIEGKYNTEPVRSAAEALALTIKALQAPETLTLQQVGYAVERSSSFWSDGLPSTFLAESAVLAYLALQRRDLAGELLDRFEEPDWFIMVGRAIERLVSGEPGEAMEATSELVRLPEVPRVTAIAGVLAAASYVASGQNDAARLRLDALWMTSRGPLIRYGLRMVPKELFFKLYDLRDTLHPGLAEVLVEAETDRHMLGGVLIPALTKSEAETLELLRARLTYPEIAEARFVSVNTVRAQVRGLYRKLQVTTREEAVTKAEHLGLLH